MTVVDWLGFIGVFQILLAYMLTVTGRWGNEHLGFILLNLTGAVMACLSSILIGYWPFILLEGVWSAVSLIALVKLMRRQAVPGSPLSVAGASGETDLSTLIRSMQPLLNPGSYVFVSVANRLDWQDFAPDEIVGMVAEREGETLIMSRDDADKRGLSYDYTAAWITLQVHSSLAAVGLTAAFSQALAQHGISCNVIAGYYHDHLFVAEADAQRAVHVLASIGDERSGL